MDYKDKLDKVLSEETNKLDPESITPGFKKFANSLGLNIEDDGSITHMEFTPTYYKCPNCGSEKATCKEIHPDTSMNEMIGSCPDCGHEGDTNEFKKIQPVQ